MNTSERWKVYPLLFLTLGIAVKDKLVKVVETDHITCKSLEIVDAKGNRQARLTSNPVGGLLQVRVVACNLLDVLDVNGNSQVLLTSNATGGILQTHGNGENPNVFLGHTDKLTGLIFSDAKGNLLKPTLGIPAVGPQATPQPETPLKDPPPATQTPETPRAEEPNFDSP